MMKSGLLTTPMLFNKVSRKRQIKHYGEWFAGGDLDYFGQSSYPIACNIIPPDLSAWEFIMPSIHWAIAVHLGPQVYFALSIDLGAPSSPKTVAITKLWQLEDEN